MKIASTQFIPKFKTAVLAGALSVAALTATSCSNTNRNQEAKQDTFELTTLQAGNLDLTKPNLPEITNDYVFYKNLDGDVIQVTNTEYPERSVASLYGAIRKMSTTETPNITDIGKFYSEVEKNIPLKNANGSNMLHATTKFKNLFDIYTHPESLGGRTITVEEYTNMMDAWSSTSYNRTVVK